jgi:hypothetical protein
VNNYSGIVDKKKYTGLEAALCMMIDSAMTEIAAGFLGRVHFLMNWQVIFDLPTEHPNIGSGVVVNVCHCFSP